MGTIEDLATFARLIEKELGIVYGEDNYYQLENRLEELARKIGVEDLRSLTSMLECGRFDPYKLQLMDLATNNETSFFRDRQVFEAFTNVVLNELPGPLKIWSAACSTGQEPLSISILLNEAGRLGSILASDISERVLSRAKKGEYSQLEVQRGLKPEFLNKYFLLNERGYWSVRESVQDIINYQRINLKESLPFTEKFDVIFCRNILIYQSLDGKKDILHRITQALSPGGFLILGTGESLLGLSSAFAQVNSKEAIIYRKN